MTRNPYNELGFDGVQFHDDDAVSDIREQALADVQSEASDAKKSSDDIRDTVTYKRTRA